MYWFSFNWTLYIYLSQSVLSSVVSSKASFSPGFPCHEVTQGHHWWRSPRCVLVSGYSPSRTHLRLKKRSWPSSHRAILVASSSKSRQGIDYVCV